MKPSYRCVVYRIQKLSLQLLGLVKFQWVREHCRILGNTVVDRVANLGHKNIYSANMLCAEEIMANMKINLSTY